MPLYHVIPTATHNELISSAYQHRGYLADEAADATRFCEMAARHGGSRSGIALAWLLRHPAGVVPNIGTTNVDRIKDAVRAESIELSRAAWYALVTAAELGPPA